MAHHRRGSRSTTTAGNIENGNSAGGTTAFRFTYNWCPRTPASAHTEPVATGAGGRIRGALDRLDERAESWWPAPSWGAAFLALVVEAFIALAIGLFTGHPWLALATAFWALPVFVFFVPMRDRWGRLDARVLGLGGPDERVRRARFNLALIGATVLAVVIAVVVALA